MTTTNDRPTSIAELERLKVLHNGEKVKLTFSDAELERRINGLRTIMQDLKLDAVVLTSYHSIKYYSDFLFTYFGRSYAMVVTADDTVTITANIARCGGYGGSTAPLCGAAPKITVTPTN